MKLKLTWLMTLFMAFVMQFSFAQEKTITGTVTSAADGLPLPGVNVIVQGTSRGVQTDFDGNYTIKASTGETLVFSFLGMKEATAQVAASNTINMVMSEDVETLEEIVVVGFSSKSRDELTSAVSNVTSEDLQKIAPSVSIDNMLQGVAAGVQVTAQNGKPGQTAFIRVRGIGSINAGNQPLYIVDGAQVNENDVNAINPNDVESVSVLKDAASTSIYGARGGNGVVLITTKRGKKGKDAVIKISSRLGRSRKVRDNFTMMNSAQKLQYERELGVGTGASIGSNAELNALLALDHDWQEDLLQDGLQQSFSFSVSGGEERMRYFFSLGYDDDTGIVRDIDGYNRSSGRLNVDYDAKPWLTVGTSLSFSSIEQGDPRDRNNAQNPFRAMYDYNPYEPFFRRDANGDVVFDANNNPVLNPTSAGYPVSSELRENLNTRYNNRFLGNMYLDMKLHENVKFLTQVSGIYDQFRRERFLTPGSTLDLIVNSNVATGDKTDSGSFDFTWTWLNKATYSNTFGEKHNLEVTALTEFVRRNYRDYLASGTGFVIGGPSVLDVSAAPDTVGGTRFENSLFSIAGNVDYNYDNRYILTATVRRDGSSRFGANTKYGTFYSGSLAWNINNEAFFKSNTINTLKLRASYGTSGNDQIGNYQSITAYGYAAYNGLNTLEPSNFGDPNLGWEQNTNYGVGVEFGLFNNRLRGLVDYYNRTTSDLLLNEQLPFSVGGPTVTGNLGEMVNKGWEFELAGDVIRTEDFRWTLNANLNLYDNEVTKLVNVDDPNTADNESDLFTSANFFSVLRVGEEVNTFFLTRYAGVNPANGEALYLDTDGNVTNVAAGNEVALSGKSPFADMDGSFGTSVQYKGWDLNANFYWKVGNYIYNIPESNMLADGDGIESQNQRLDAFNYWRNPGDTNVLPRPSSAGFAADAAQTSDRFLQKGDYIRLRSLQLGYTLPKRFTDAMALDNVRIYAAGTNLWTYAPEFKGDPEIGIGSGETQTAGTIPGEFALYSYPTTATIAVGFDIQF
ncbi:SusC/RagA family TonB-linked outer membrane protein [Psychroserpens mesophilus]|uniref:SusC/RagA family TonB-linked outer membrane protein n=1 Tax=Psychroserpens mesophilus TaxID=325473 RepID=UPI003F499FA4